MANDVVANPGAGGATFVTDEIAGRHWPAAKLAWGVEDAAVWASDTDPFPVKVLTGATPAVTAVEATTSEVQLIAATARRNPLIIKNDADTRLYVKYGSGITPRSFTDWIEPRATWVMPGAVYAGAVYGNWDPKSAGVPPSGRALVTDVTN